jgi:hypothetical protein
LRFPINRLGLATGDHPTGLFVGHADLIARLLVHARPDPRFRKDYFHDPLLITPS